MLCRNHIDVSEGIRRCARCGAPFCSDCLVDISGRPYCATCKTEQILEVRSGVERGVLDLASIGRRFGASFVDGLLMWIPIAIMIAIGIHMSRPSTNDAPKRRPMLARSSTPRSTPERTSKICSVLHVAQYGLPEMSTRQSLQNGAPQRAQRRIPSDTSM